MNLFKMIEKKSKMFCLLFPKRSLREAVGHVLQELEASRTGGENSFISNNSFSLQRLLYILGGKQGASG